MNTNNTTCHRWEVCSTKDIHAQVGSKTNMTPMSPRTRLNKFSGAQNFQGIEVADQNQYRPSIAQMQQVNPQQVMNL